MREILFKAKRKDNGEWVEGYYIYHIKRTPSPIGDSVKPEDEQHVIMRDGFSDWNMPRNTVHFDIDPETLCQYTGLQDKNGKRIWENDIVLLREEIQDYEWKAAVKFGNPNREYNWGWQLVPVGECEMNKDILLWIDMDIANCEVIGNIFDNPELLGGHDEQMA